MSKIQKSLLGFSEEKKDVHEKDKDYKDKDYKEEDEEKNNINEIKKIENDEEKNNINEIKKIENDEEKNNINEIKKIENDIDNVEFEKVEFIEKVGFVEEKIIRKPNQIETDYYEKSRVEICATRLRERFHVNIVIKEVRYGTKPPLNEKIYGYYLIITIKSGDIEKISNFIKEECRLKVYR